MENEKNPTIKDAALGVAALVAVSAVMTAGAVIGADLGARACEAVFNKLSKKN